MGDLDTSSCVSNLALWDIANCTIDSVDHGISNLLTGDTMVCPQTLLRTRHCYSTFCLPACGVPGLARWYLCLALTATVDDSDAVSQPLRSGV